MIVVEKRYPGEKYDVREFVQPNSLMVRELATRLSHERDFASACWTWVRNNIRYPPGGVRTADWHRHEAFPTGGLLIRAPLVVQESFDFWQFPAETLSTRIGDCEDMAILLCSLLRTKLPESSVYVTIGDYRGYGHAWVTVNGTVYDPTPADGYLPPTPESPPYRPWFRFNDRIVIQTLERR